MSELAIQQEQQEDPVLTKFRDFCSGDPMHTNDLEYVRDRDNQRLWIRGTYRNNTTRNGSWGDRSHARRCTRLEWGNMLVINGGLLGLALGGALIDDDTFREIEDSIIFRGSANRGKYEKSKGT